MDGWMDGWIYRNPQVGSVPLVRATSVTAAVVMLVVETGYHMKNTHTNTHDGCEIDPRLKATIVFLVVFIVVVVVVVVVVVIADTGIN